MAKVRVHELAKNLNIQAKDIIGFLSEKNIEIKSHMSTLEENEIDMVNHKFVKKENGAIVKTEVKTKAEENKAEKTQAEDKTAADKQDRPKKKSSITAVFNPQNSKQGPARRQNPQGQGNPGNRRPQGERSQTDRPVAEHTKVERQVEKQSVQGKEAQVKATSEKTVVKQEQEVKSPETNTVSAASSTSSTPTQEHPKTQGNVYANRPQTQGNVYANRPQTQGNVYANRPKTQGNVYANRPQGERQGNVYANRPKTQGNVYANRPQGERQGNGYNNNRPQGERQGNVYANRPQGDRQGTGYNNNRPQGGQGTGYNNNRPQSGGRPQFDRSGTGNGTRPQTGGRPYDKNNQRGYQNNRPGAGGNTGDRNSRGIGTNRPKDAKGRLDQDINKFNKDSSSTVDELRGKETRDRSENRKGNNVNNKRQEYDKLGGKRQERFVNLEKNGGKKKPQQQPRPEEKQEDTIRTITIPERLTIRELGDKMKVPAAAIVKKLFLKGTMVTLNQEVDFDAAGEIALEFNCIVEAEIKIDVIAELLKEDDESEENMIARPPVVCVMGHVDHGKTSLLDAIRSTKVTDREAGGITQHIGASVVSINGQNITFLDTPGHEAFTSMRMRGANATDIAILVVAADDGVMPQTIEAINHAKAAGIEIIVAVNKIDKPSANIERVKQELSEYQLIPEDWGGSTIFCPVSAHTHDGIDNLLEMILLTAEVCELKANPKRTARGLVIEAQLDKGRGAVATILVQKGTLKVGEPIACGSCYGKVRAMIDDEGRRVKEAGPSTPVEILGLSGVPNAGEVFVSTSSDKEARSFADTFISEGKERLLEETKAKMSLDDLFSQIKSGNVKELDVIVKADVQGSVEAVKQSLEKLSNEEVVVKTIHGGVGAINESDVILASASNAIIIGFNVRPDITAKATAEREGVDVRLYKVIYNAIEDVEAAMKGMLDPIFEEKVLGHAEVRQVFKASGIGNIAGSYILDGTFERGCKVRITREGTQVFDGDLASLKRFKDDVKEVKTGYECGLVIDGFNEIQEFDQIEAYKMVEVPR